MIFLARALHGPSKRNSLLTLQVKIKGGKREGRGNTRIRDNTTNWKTS